MFESLVAFTPQQRPNGNLEMANTNSKLMC